MPLSRPAALLRQLTSAPDSPHADVELLRAFIASRSEPAFAELVHRHGPMVLSVCRRVLGHVHDAEDAFQAVFLVLAQKAATVQGKNIAGWLYSVAVRIARGVRLMRNRRQKRELVASTSLGQVPIESTRMSDSSRSIEDADLAAILDEELAKLPEHYRLAVVLCELEGRSRKEAALELGIPEGTLSSRLAAARKRLAERLSLRGVEVTAGLLAAVFAQAATARLPEGLAESTARVAVAVTAGKTATGLVSPLVSEAARLGMKATFAAKLRAVLVIAAALGFGLAGWSLGRGDGGSAAAVASDTLREQKAAEPPKPADPPKKGAKFWPHFVKVVGDDKASRELFDLIVSSQKSVGLLENIAEAEKPDPALSLWYFARQDELHDESLKPSDKMPGVPQLKSVPTSDIAGWLLLGTYPGTKVASNRDVSLIYMTDLEGQPFADALSDESSIVKPLRKLLGAWLANRGDDVQAYIYGFSFALHYDIPEALATARRVLKYYSGVPKERRQKSNVAYARIMCLLVIGEHGAKDDLPLIEACFDDRVVAFYTTRKRNDPLNEKVVNVQVRDTAAAVAIHLCGGKPGEFELIERTRNRFNDRFGRWDVTGFETDAEREPVHKAALEWLDKHKGPPHGPVKALTVPAEVGALAFDPKSGNLVVCSQDFSVQTWDPSTGKPVSVFRAGAEGSVAVGLFSALTFSPDGKRMAVRYFVADRSGKFLFGLEGHVAEITRMHYDRDGKRILSSSWDGTIRIWEADTGKLLRTIEAHMGTKDLPGPQNGVGPKPMGSQPERFEGRGVRDAAFSPNGKRIVSGGVDGTIRIWNAETGKEVWGVKVSQALMAVAYLPNGTQVVSGEKEGGIRIWDADDGKEVKKLTGHTSAVTCLAVTPDGKRLVSAACDNTVRVWDLESGRELRCFRGHTKWVYAISISPDGKTVASGGEDRVVRIWEMP